MKLPTRYKNIYVHFNALPEHIPVKGNAVASGDDELDTKVEQEIIDRLNNDDIYAWFVAEVYATCGELQGESEYLGGCCYEDANDFVENSGSFDDMKEEAIKSLLDEMELVSNEFQSVIKGEQNGLERN